MPSDKKNQEVVDSANALVEMYKAGFMDGYTPKPRTKKDFEILNKKYKKKFLKRFMKKLDKELKTLKKKGKK